MAFIGPRFAFFLLWIFDTDRVNAAFSSTIWPVLGIIFAPWTALMYTLAWGPVHGVSGVGWFVVAVGILLDLLTPLSRRCGPELNRDTVGNVQKAGFRLRREENVYLDIVKIIEAEREAPGGL